MYNFEASMLAEKGMICEGGSVIHILKKITLTRRVRITPSFVKVYYALSVILTTLYSANYIVCRHGGVNYDF